MGVTRKRERTARARRKRHVQQALVFSKCGGKRPGAGRKRVRARPSVPHRRRPELNGRTPVHVTLRVCDDVKRLRRRDLFRVIRAALARTCEKPRFRLVHFTIQGNHLHLYVEPLDKLALSRGMQGMKSLIARMLNRATGRSGRVFDDRYHARYLRTPAEVRAALCYVLCNWRRHREDVRAPRALTDWYSSADLFDGWDGLRPRPPPWLDLRERSPVVAPRMWLTTVGWRRHGLIDPRAIPGPAA